jgi:hypothetical protein
VRTRARDPDRSTEQASKNLEFRRHRHLLGVPCWMLTGVVYLALVFSTGY